MKEGYKVKRIDKMQYAVCYRDKYGRESIWVSCYLKENAKTICDILNTDRKDKVCEPHKKCQNCVSRYICPTYRENKCCMGYNDEQIFGTLLKMMFGGMANKQIDGMLERVKIIQGRLPDERI
jgi:hypothetical protein